MPLSWATATPPIGVVLTLSFWIGLGNATLPVRLLSGIVGATYLVSGVFVFDALQNLLSVYEPTMTTSDLVVSAVALLVALTLFSGTFMALRRWWALLPANASNALIAPKSQFSIRYVLLLTAGAAIVFTFVRLSRDAADVGDINSIATSCLVLVVLGINAVHASFAALRPGPIVRSCVLVLLVAYALGGALSFGMGDDLEGWQPFAFGPIYSVLPTAILLGSLLVVRSIGYRLLRKSEMTSSTHEQLLDESGALPLHSPDAAERMSR